MKIDDIIRKCIEIPGISIKRSDFSAELLMKTKDGKGSMTFFPLFSGLTIAYIFVNSPTWVAPNFCEDSSIEKGPLLLNYCVTGRCEIVLNNENFVYVKDREISLTERFAQKQYVYPRRIYEDVSSFFQFSNDIRRIMYTTNIIEGLNRQYRKVTKTKSVFPSDSALEKMLYLASENVVKKWTQRYRNWNQVLNQLIVLYGERLTAYL